MTSLLSILKVRGCDMMVFLIDKEKGTIEDLDKVDKRPCDLCINGMFALGFAVHDECVESYNDKSKEEKQRLFDDWKAKRK